MPDCIATRFPQGETPRLLIDLGNGIASDPVEGKFVVEKDTVISGYRHSHGWAADKTFYFVAEFSRPFKSLWLSRER